MTTSSCGLTRVASMYLFTQQVSTHAQLYRMRAMCFVYLDDVPASACSASTEGQTEAVPQILINNWTVADMEEDQDQYDAFCKCRWLTRGWTLQEMLAPDPQAVQFFNADWTSLGSLTDLAQVVARATGINIRVLTSGEWRMRPRDCSIAQRMAWAATRRTTRIEDRAYSLLGLFGVNMPILYGEGQKAFFRLQEAIMRESPDDLTILYRNPTSEGRGRADLLLAEVLEDFENSSDIVVHHQTGTDFELLTHGVRVTLQALAESDTGRHVLAALPCRSSREGNMFSPCLRLEKDYHTDTYFVAGRALVDSYELRGAEMRSLTIRYAKRTTASAAPTQDHGPIKLQSTLTTGISKILVRGSGLIKARHRFTERGLSIIAARPAPTWNNLGAYFAIPTPLPAKYGFRAEVDLSFHFAHNRETALRLFVSLASVEQDSFSGYEWTAYKRATMDFASMADNSANWTPLGSGVESMGDRCVRPWERAPKGWNVQATMMVMKLRNEAVLVVEIEAQPTGETIEYDDPADPQPV